MYRLIHSIALLSALLVVVAGLWQDWGLLTSLKRIVVSYLAFFVLGSLMVVGMRTIALFDGDAARREADGEGAAPARGRRRTATPKHDH